MRQQLDNITAKEVVFNPYKNNRVGAMEDVVYYHGPLFHPNGFSMYNPIRIMRQLGFIQDSPDEDYVPPFKHKLEKCEADEAGIKVAYEPEVDVKHWNDRHSRLVDISWWVHADEGHEATPDYVEWYEGFSHGRVIWVDPTPGRRTNRASTSSSSQVDSRDATSILTLVRMKLLAKAFCFLADKGEVMDPAMQRPYAEYCTHIENTNAKKMFKDLAKEVQWISGLLKRLYAQSGLLFAKPRTSSDSRESSQEETNKILSNLKTSLSQTLDYFFPLAGRLAVTKHDDDGTISVYINCNSAGVEFIHAVADVTKAVLLKPTCTADIIDSFFTFDGIRNYQGVSLPLLSVQVTVLTDGIFVAFSTNHSVCDGTSFSHFINSWSQISRGLTHKLHPPIILEPRWLPRKTNFPIHLPFSSIEALTIEKFIPSPELRKKTFHFTPQNIRNSKGKPTMDMVLRFHPCKLCQLMFG
ncbi:BAHD acyltransferase DCR-like [Papaver somniferum]|uniref:BAHD acyltransferase DCR-like n=1 Tax=Papaver somniferum TaxID=3469 RepID=UPI000E704298|nr:BAHD acyltransferase DCR-like [Papaver somniferum]